MRHLVPLLALVGCYRDAGPASAPARPAVASLVTAPRPADYAEVDAISISRLIPSSKWPDLPGHVVGVVYGGGPQPWGVQINNLRGFETDAGREAYRLSVDGSTSYTLYWRASTGGEGFERRIACSKDRKLASAIQLGSRPYAPGAPNRYGLTRRAHVAELEINLGHGSCQDSVIATAAKILDGTDAVAFDTEQVLIQLRKRFDATVHVYEPQLRATMDETHRPLEGEKRERVVGALPTWLGDERQLEVLFIVRDQHEGSLQARATSSASRDLFAHPAPVPPIHFVHGAAMAVRYTVDRTGALVHEQVYRPAAFTAHRGEYDDARRGDDWYGE